MNGPADINNLVAKYVAWRLSKVSPEAWDKDTVDYMTTDFRRWVGDDKIPIPDAKPPPVPSPEELANIRAVVLAQLETVP